MDSAASLMVGSTFAAHAQQVTLKYAFVNPMNSHFGVAVTAFKRIGRGRFKKVG